MKSAKVWGYSLAAGVGASVLLFVLLLAWGALFPRQVDQIELGVVLLILAIPLAGIAVAVTTGIWLAARESQSESVGTVVDYRVHDGIPAGGDPTRLETERRWAARVVPRNPPSTADGVVLLVVALVPGLWSAFLFWSDRDSLRNLMSADFLSVVFFLGPLVAAVGLVVSGTSIIWRARK